MTRAELPRGPEGFVASGFENVAEAFEHNFAEHGEVGAAFAAYVDGDLVVDLWGGSADRRGNVPWRSRHARSHLLGHEGVSGNLLLLLLERGQLNLDDTVRRYGQSSPLMARRKSLSAMWSAIERGFPGLVHRSPLKRPPTM